MAVTFAPRHGGGTVRVPRQIIPAANGRRLPMESLNYLNPHEQHMLTLLRGGRKGPMRALQ